MSRGNEETVFKRNDACVPQKRDVKQPLLLMAGARWSQLDQLQKTSDGDLISGQMQRSDEEVLHAAAAVWIHTKGVPGSGE